jgi:hypothetical protein
MNKSKILVELFRSKNPILTLSNVKKIDYINASKKIKQALKHPITKKILYHDASLPKDFRSIRNTKQLEYSGNLEGELAWFVNSLSSFSKEINTFIELEEKLEELILFDKYVEAKTLIENVNEKVCYSYWALENLFSIEEKLNGTEKNWHLLKQKNNLVDIPYTLFFNGFYSKKSEKDTTILHYQRELENVVKVMDKKDVEYILFKLGYFYTEDYTEYAYFLYAENLSSVIDKYLFLIEVLFELANINEYKTLVNQVINELDKFNIKDVRIDRLKEFCELDVLQSYNEDILNLFDLYSTGKDYNKCIEVSIELIRKNPTATEVYEIYLKSLLELNTGFVKTNISHTIDDLLKNFYSLFNRDNEYYSSRENLLKYYLSFPKLNSFKQVLSLVSNITGIESTKNIINKSTFIYSKYSNPALITLEKYSNKFNSEDLEKHISLKINYAIANNDFSTLEKEEIPFRKLELYKLRANFYRNEGYDYDLLLKLYNDNKLNIFFHEEVILYLYTAYINDDKINDAISLFVNAYFRNKFLVERLKKGSVLNYIIDKNCDIGDISINLPIYFYLENANSYYQYTALEVFLNNNDVEKPSELDNIRTSETNMLVFVLSKICTVDVLNNFYLVYESDSEVIEERKEILKKLATLDSENSDSYFEEIATLSQKLKVKEIIETVNDGKINLNFSRIKEDKEYNLENTFNRFIRFKDFSDQNDMILIDTSDLVTSYLSELKNDTSKLQEASFVSFKSLFFEIVDYFLFSKEHGLDGDLSTRIRHGVLENQIRSVFINKHLIATKNKKDNYNDIIHWEKLCNEKAYKPEIVKKVQKTLKYFTKKIDTFIFDIINEYIQIQSNRHTSNKLGLFNYRFTDEIMWVIYKEVTDRVDDYEDFLNYTFDILKTHTETLLKGIAKKFQTSMNDNFQNLLMNLEDDISKILNTGDKVYSELNQNINNTRTDIQNELYNISKWFKISNNLSNSILDIETIIQTAIESININSEIIKPKLIVDSEHFFEAGFYYIDIFKILLENSIKHSGLTPDKLHIQIEVKTLVLYNDFEKQEVPISKLIILIKNNLSDDIDHNEVSGKIGKIVNSWNSDLSIVNQEGGSGFQKIRRILKYDIKAIESSLSYNLKDSELNFAIEIINNIREIDED